MIKSSECSAQCAEHSVLVYSGTWALEHFLAWGMHQAG